LNLTLYSCRITITLFIRIAVIKRVNNKKEMLDVLKDKKAELKDFISKNKPDFRKDFEKALVQTAKVL
jgi:type III secretory pathway component EscR